jgi:hypothetical protein
MNPIVPLALIFIGTVFLSCEDDLMKPVVPSAPSTPTEVPVVNTVFADFSSPNLTLAETKGEPVEITILLSQPVSVESKVIIRVYSDRTDTFIIDPQPENGELILNASVGDTILSFNVQPVDNSVVTGHSSITFSIAATEGAILTGAELTNVLTIQDDELALKVMGYETRGSGDVAKRVYEYDSKGRIAKVNWETRTPYARSGTHTWFYDDNDRLIRINKYPGHDVHYSWDAGKIWKEDVYQDGTLVQYTIYAYDAKGNIGGSHPYYRQSDGSFKGGLFLVYLYFNDGNIYKSLMYSQEEEADPVLLSTKTYDKYLEVNNPFPMVEILPSVRSQTKLATSYRVEENGFDFEYSITYQFREDGLPAQRIASSVGGSETTIYSYY